jgi:hypothetical protein
MRKVEHVEVVIDRVLYTLDCGCVRKSEIVLNAQRLAELAKTEEGRQYCEKHDPFYPKQVFICKNCHTVGSVGINREDTIESVWEKVFAVHDTDKPSCKRTRIADKLVMWPHSSRTKAQDIKDWKNIPEWAIEPITKILGLEDKVDA